MERLVDLGSLVRTLKAGLHKPNPANPDRKMWTLTDLDKKTDGWQTVEDDCCLLYTSPSPRDRLLSRMPSSA